MINLRPPCFLDLQQVAENHTVYEYTIFFDDEQARRLLYPVLKMSPTPAGTLIFWTLSRKACQILRRGAHP